MRPAIIQNTIQDIVIVDLDATEPELLIYNDERGYLVTPAGLWMRLSEARDGCWPVMQFQGPRAVVRDYIALHWGDDAVESLQEDGLL